MVPVVVGAMVVGGAISAYSRYSQGQAAKRAGKRMAREFERMAAETLQKGEESAFLSATRARQIMGAARTAFAKSTTDVEEGALAQTAYAGAWETAAIRNNARREAWGLQRRAQIALQEGAEAASAANISAGASLIDTGVKIAAMSYTPSGGGDINGVGGGYTQGGTLPGVQAPTLIGG